jgi:hypothetical protein
LGIGVLGYLTAALMNASAWADHEAEIRRDAEHRVRGSIWLEPRIGAVAEKEDELIEPRS